METDYSDLSNDYFINQVKKYVSYNLLNLNQKNISDKTINNNQIELKQKKFKYFIYDELFNIEK